MVICNRVLSQDFLSISELTKIRRLSLNLFNGILIIISVSDSQKHFLQSCNAYSVRAQSKLGQILVERGKKVFEF